ncbi:MAG: dimethylarginine dimethylaminohydrolase family protein [bacterium]
MSSVRAQSAAAPFGSHSEYGVLREVVIGDARGLELPPFGKDLSHYNDELRAALLANGERALSVQQHFPQRWEETCRQIDGVAKAFEDNGVAVHRLRPYTAPEKEYLSALQRGCSQLYPADPVFVVGAHFIEVNIRRAYRRKEVFPIRDIVLPMLAADARASYAAMPHAQPWSPSGEGPGPFLEGGDILVQGKDVLVGIGDLCSDRAGFDWLTRHLAPHGYTTWAMPIVGDVMHALGALCLLREGLAMAHLPTFAEGLPPPIADWEVIEITAEEMRGHATVGVSLDPRRYLIDPRHARVMEALSKHGIEPLPTPCDAIGYWGGAIRCITLPLKRDPA